MDTYVILGNYTQQGVEKIKESPDRIEAGRKAFEAAGGKLLSCANPTGLQGKFLFRRFP